MFFLAMHKIKIQVMSEREIVQIKQFPKNTCIISIRNPDNHNYSIPFPAPYIALFFADQEDLHGISEEQANQIAHFVESQVEKGNTSIIVHCEMGVSRSAGVAAAILQKYTGDISQIVDSPSYDINARCYEYVCKALGCDVTSYEVQDAAGRSRQAYLSGWPKL